MYKQKIGQKIDMTYKKGVKIYKNIKKNSTKKSLTD